jgi:hypothetical protein
MIRIEKKRRCNEMVRKEKGGWNKENEGYG